MSVLIIGKFDQISINIELLYLGQNFLHYNSMEMVLSLKGMLL